MIGMGLIWRYIEHYKLHIYGRKIMSFQGFFVLAVVLLIIAPNIIIPLAGRLIEQLLPIAQQGLTLAIIVAAIGFVLSSLK